MSSPRWLLLTLAVVILGQFSTSALSTPASAFQGKEKQQPIEALREISESAALFHSRKQFVEHGKAMMKDIGYGGLAPMVDTLLEFKAKGAFDEEKPIILYGDLFGANTVMVLQIKDKQKLLEYLNLDGKDVDLTRPFETDDDPGIAGLPVEGEFAGILGNDYAIGSKKSVANYLKSKPVGKFFSDETAKLINESGLVLFHKFDPKDGPLYIGERQRKHYDEEELAAYKKIEEASKFGQIYLAGFTYEKKTLEARLHAMIRENKFSNELFDFEIAKQPVRTTIGLPKKQLILSLSARLSTFKSPATLRMLAKQMFVYGPEDFLFEQRLSRLASDMFAEAWHELDTVRLGLYVADEGEVAGSMALIGIVDPKKPEAFPARLQSLIQTVDSPENDAAKKQKLDQIKNWISQLSDRNFEVRRRASARLLLAGLDAEEPLRKATQSGSPEQRMRANLVLRRLKQNISKAADNLNNENQSLWNSVQPTYELVKGPIEIQGKEAQLIQMKVADPENPTNARFIVMMRQLFGKNWDKIHLVQVGERFAFMIGSSDKLFAETVENLKQGKDPIREVVKKNPRRLNSNNQVEVHMSAGRVIDYFVKPEYDFRENDDRETITSMGLRISPRSWEGSFHIPANDIEDVLRYIIR